MTIRNKMRSAILAVGVLFGLLLLPIVIGLQKIIVTLKGKLPLL